MLAVPLTSCGRDNDAPDQSPTHTAAQVPSNTTDSASEAVKADNAENPSAPVLVATHAELSCIVRELIGDAARVVTVGPASGAPADYAPSRDDARMLRDAVIVFRSGFGGDPWIETLGLGGARGVLVTRGLGDLLIKIGETTHSHGTGGAHSHPVFAVGAWRDPAIAPLVIERIARALRDEFPDQADAIDRNSAALLGRIAALAAELSTPHDFPPEAVVAPSAGGFVVDGDEPWRYTARWLGAEYAPSSGSSDGESADACAWIERSRRIAKVFNNGL